MKQQSFRERVRCVVAGIPKGSVMTYGEVARRAGNAKAARAVGAIMNANRSSWVPCHRVVASGGNLGGFNGGLKAKEKMLRSEGVVVKYGRVNIGK